MDPLSIAASVVGLLGATVKVSTMLNTFVQGLKNVPNVAREVLQEVSDIRTCLAQLQAFLMGTRVGSRSRTALLMVDQVMVILTSCVMTFSELEQTVESLNDDRASKRMIWPLREPKLEKLCQRLNSTKLSLNLILTTLTCASVDQATSSVEQLAGLVRQVLQTNQDLCLRIGNLELSHSNQTIRSATSLNENDEEDGASTIRTKRSASDPASEASDQGIKCVMGFTFEQDLRQSKVYKRAWQRNSLASLSSSASPSFGWSCLSETSLANLSNISVISLPIAANELANGKHYRGSSFPEQVLTENSRRAKPQEVTPPLARRMSAMDQSSHRVERKVAILGSSLSGKTTVYRQIQSMQGHNFSEGQREEYRATILDNLISASLLLSFRVRDPEIELNAVAQKNLATLSLLHGINRNVAYNTVVRYVEALRSLLRIPVIRSLMRSEDLQGLHDNVEFFSHRFESLFVTDCTAADCDIFSARSEPTKGRQSYSFSLGSIQYDIIDHGGNYSEQEANWVPSYSTANLIIFTVALSGYCRCTVDGMNQILDAMDAFKRVSAAVRVPILLLFTKVDIFEELLSTHQFTDYFPSYRGPMDSFNIRVHLTLKFYELCPGSNERLFIHVVDATVPEAFRKFFEKERPLMNDEDDHNAPLLDVYDDYDDGLPWNAYDDEDLRFNRDVMVTENVGMEAPFWRQR